MKIGNSNEEKIIGYCMRCKEKREMENVKVGTNSKGAKYAQGTCKNCSTKMFKILPRK